MTGFESIIDQKQPIGILSTLLSSEHIHHALLFTGIEGVGKYNAAITFAMACNCAGLDSGPVSEYVTNSKGAVYQEQQQKASSVPCGCCRSCKKIQSDSHPDILSIKPTGSYIKIDQIRALYRILAMKPYEATYRVVIMSEAQRLNPAASNAFLKILEEPPDQTILILIAGKKTDLLQTIVSRCQHVRFNPISRKALVAALSEKEGCSRENAFALATMSKGSLSRALSMNRTNWIGHRDWLIHTLGLNRQEVQPKPANLLFSISAQLSENRDTVDDYLEIIISWLRDLIIFKYQPDKIIHQDLLHTIENISGKFTIQSLLYKIGVVQKAQLAIQRPNTNIKLVLDILMQELTENVNDIISTTYH